SVVSLPAADPASGRLRKPVAEFLDRVLARPLFFLALLFLIISAGVIHRIGHGHTTAFEAEVILWCLYLLWPVFLADALVRLVLCGQPEKFWHRLAYCGLLALAPPFRVCAPSYRAPDLV